MPERQQQAPPLPPRPRGAFVWRLLDFVLIGGLRSVSYSTCIPAFLCKAVVARAEILLSEIVSLLQLTDNCGGKRQMPQPLSIIKG